MRHVLVVSSGATSACSLCMYLRTHRVFSVLSRARTNAMRRLDTPIKLHQSMPGLPASHRKPTLLVQIRTPRASKCAWSARRSAASRCTEIDRKKGKECKQISTSLCGAYLRPNVLRSESRESVRGCHSRWNSVRLVHAFACITHRAQRMFYSSMFIHSFLRTNITDSKFSHWSISVRRQKEDC